MLLKSYVELGRKKKSNGRTTQKVLLIFQVASPHNAPAPQIQSFFAFHSPSVCLLGWCQVFLTRCHRDIASSAEVTAGRGTTEMGKRGGGEKWQNRQFERGGGRRWAIFSLSILQVQRANRYKKSAAVLKKEHGHHGNLDRSLCQNDNCSLLHPHLSHSQIALYSHEYFIFILLKQRSVPFVLPLLCILTRRKNHLVK